MKKKILMGCLLCMMAVSMVACANKSESMEDETRKERERDSDSDEGSALLGQLADLIGDEVPLAAAVAETKTETVAEESVAEVWAEEDIREVEVEPPTMEKNVVEETVVEATTVEAEVAGGNADIYNLSVAEPVFYNENGVTLTFEGFVEDYSDVALKIRVDNNNPDNKKAHVQIHQIVINNVLANDHSVDYEYKNAGNSCAVLTGQSDIITAVADQDNPCFWDESEQYHNMFYEWQQERIGIPNNKVHTVAIEYYVKIGSDSEGEERKVVLKTADYEEGYLESFYGDYIASVELDTHLQYYIGSKYDSYRGISKEHYQIVIDNKANIDIYKKDTGSGTLFIMRNTDDELVNGYTYSMYVNGENIEHLNNAFNCSAELLIGNGGIDVYELDIQPEEIRAELEIPNDVPLNFTMRITGIRGQDPIDVPVMTIQ